MTLDQLDLRLKRAVHQDARISHALAYGSRTQRVGGALLSDEYSDLEYYLFVRAGDGVWAQRLSELSGRAAIPRALALCRDLAA